MTRQVVMLDQVGSQSPQDIIGRDMVALADTLGRWLRDRGVDVAAVEDLAYPTGAGQSNETILFTLVEPSGVRQKLVLRIAPDTYRLFMNTNFDAQHRLLDALGRGHHVRVPEILWREDDPALLGQRFFVMRQLSGFVPVSKPPYNAAGRLFDAVPRDRERLWQNALTEMTRIHRVPVAEVAFLRDGRAAGTGLRALLDYETASFQWAADGREVPALSETLEWLVANVPRAVEDGLSWGDARIGNMMFNDDFDLVGVFDWEQMSLAGGGTDLGWWLFFDVLYSRMIGLERLDGLGDRARTIATWSVLTGRAATDVEWYEIFSGFRLATIFLRKAALDRFSVPGANIGNNMFTRLIAEIRQMAPPPDIIEDYSR